MYDRLLYVAPSIPWQDGTEDRALQIRNVITRMAAYQQAAINIAT